jgi:UPF0271 protein
MLTTPLINADMGEVGKEIDALIMPHIHMANIACGGHIGDTHSIQTTITLAQLHNVRIGAHISYNDTLNFGRVSQDISIAQLQKDLTKQLQHFKTIDYIKPHGALYHDSWKDVKKFTLLLQLCKQYQAFLVVQKDILNAHQLQLAKRHSVQLLFEMFADRGYRGNHLIPRSEHNAVLTSATEIITQYTSFKNQADHNDTICFHSDNSASIQALQQL